MLNSITLVESIVALAALVTIGGGVSAFIAFFSRNSPFIIAKRSVYSDLQLQRGNDQKRGTTEKNLEHIITADGRKWVWRRETNNSNMRSQGVSFFEIAESVITSTMTEGMTQSELKRSFMTVRGSPLYCCIYYEGEGYNRVFGFYPNSDDRSR